jgi:hypothetical protein
MMLSLPPRWLAAHASHVDRATALNAAGLSE